MEPVKRAKVYQPRFLEDATSYQLPSVDEFRLDNIITNALGTELYETVEKLTNVFANYQSDLRLELKLNLAIEQKIQYKNIHLSKVMARLATHVSHKKKKHAKLVDEGIAQEVGQLASVARDVSVELQGILKRIENVNVDSEKYPALAEWFESKQRLKDDKVNSKRVVERDINGRIKGEEIEREGDVKDGDVNEMEGDVKKRIERNVNGNNEAVKGGENGTTLNDDDRDIRVNDIDQNDINETTVNESSSHADDNEHANNNEVHAETSTSIPKTTNGEVLGIPSPTHSNGNAHSTLLLKGDERSLQNGDVCSLRNGDVRSLLNEDVRSLLNGDARSLLNEDARSLLNGDVRSLLNGDVRSLLNGDVRSLLNGDVRSLLNGDVRSLLKDAIPHEKDPSNPVRDSDSEMSAAEFEEFMSCSITKYRQIQSQKKYDHDPFATSEGSDSDKRKQLPEMSFRSNPINLLYSSLLANPNYTSTPPISTLPFSNFNVKSSPTIKLSNQITHFKKLRINGSPITSETFLKHPHEGSCACSDTDAHKSLSETLLQIDTLKLESEDEAWNSSGLNTDIDDEDANISSDSSEDSPTHSSINETNEFYSSMQKKRKRLRKATLHDTQHELSPTPKHKPSHHTLKPRRLILKTTGSSKKVVQAETNGNSTADAMYSNERSGISAVNKAFDQSKNNEVSSLYVSGTIIGRDDDVSAEDDVKTVSLLRSLMGATNEDNLDVVSQEANTEEATDPNVTDGENNQTKTNGNDEVNNQANNQTNK